MDTPLVDNILAIGKSLIDIFHSQKSPLIATHLLSRL